MGSKRFIVMIVRKKYISPNRKHKYLNISTDALKSKDAFVKELDEKCVGWRDTTYFLKEDDGKIYAKFDIRNGKIKQLHKESPVTGESYRCWLCFKDKCINVCK